MRRLKFFAVLVGLVVLALGEAYALPLSGTSFNGFIVGASIHNQGGWSSDNPAWDEEVANDGTGNVVWRVSNAVTSGSFGDMPFAPRSGGIPLDTVSNPVNGDPLFFAGEPSTGAAFDRFLGQFSFRSVTGAYQPGLRITTSLDNGQGGRQSFIAIEDTPTGIEISTFDVDNSGNFIGPIIIASNLSYTAWHTIGMEAKFKKGENNDRVKYLVDGKKKHTGSTWEQFYRNFQASLHPLGVPVQTLLFRLSGTAAPSTNGNGYYVDNVFTSTSKGDGENDDD